MFCSLPKEGSIGSEILHYQNLTRPIANLTYMHAKFGISYPELYRRMKLPVFDGVQEALESAA